jgi:hypothetical protein
VGVKLELHTLYTSTVDGNEWSRPRLGRITTVEESAPAINDVRLSETKPAWAWEWGGGISDLLRKKPRPPSWKEPTLPTYSAYQNKGKLWLWSYICVRNFGPIIFMILARYITSVSNTYKFYRVLDNQMQIRQIFDLLALSFRNLKIHSLPQIKHNTSQLHMSIVNAV